MNLCVPLAQILCIHLKRFRHELMFSTKIGTHVSFPLEGLDLQSFLAKDGSAQTTNYDLLSVICHHGTASSESAHPPSPWQTPASRVHYTPLRKGVAGGVGLRRSDALCSLRSQVATT